MDVKRHAHVVAVMGATGSGKSAWIKQQLAALQPDRLLVFDPDGEYSHLARPVPTLRELVQGSALPTFRLAFQPTYDNKLAVRQFKAFCQIAWHRLPCTVVVEELSELVRANGAPAPWARLVKRGRKHGATVYAAAQRPAEIDKTFWSNATVIRAGSLAFDDDHATMARALNVPRERVAALGKLEFLELDRNSSKGVVCDLVTFPGQRSRPTGRPKSARRAG
jgi:hypothetical protein